MSVVFHNLKSYDGHHLMRYGLAHKLHWELNPIYQSGDKLLAVIARILPSQSDVVSEEEQRLEEEDVYDADEVMEAQPKKRRKVNYYRIYRLFSISSGQPSKNC